MGRFFIWFEEDTFSGTVHSSQIKGLWENIRKNFDKNLTKVNKSKEYNYDKS